MNSVDSDKKTIRKNMLYLRDRMTETELADKSTQIHKLLNSVNAYHTALWFMSYVSFGNEVNTTKIINKLFEKKRKVAVPVCISETNQIVASQIFDLDKLIPSLFGILEPDKEQLLPIDPKKLEIVLVPGLAFDIHGNRVGYGKGYYDRFLIHLNPNSLKIGLAYDFQLLDEIPSNSYDIPVDIIVTDKRIIDIKGMRQ